MNTFLRIVASIAAGCALAGGAGAQEYPRGPVKIIVPYPAGGYTDIAHLDGGLAAWKAARFTTTVDVSQPISIMRQVLIVAGSLTLAGAILAWVISPWFILLSAFVGAGLMFAGITDTCMMAMLLTKLPYNQPKPAIAKTPVQS